ncbi:MAG: TrmB family transcriptional regulator [Nitrososphaerales archaeon]
MRSHDQAPSLEEFGLSRYESRAYLTLLGKGPLSASELAYYSSLPRTKVYSTLTKLSRKGLVVVTQDKPLICTAVSPHDAFEALLSAQEGKINGMKTTIEKLQKISEESKRPHSTEEHRYLTLDPPSVLATLKGLIHDAKEEFACIIDGWGLRIISQCKEALLKSVTNNLSVKILVSKDCLGSDMLSSIPHGTSIRVGHCGVNLFLMDRSTTVMVNSSNGRGALFRSSDILSNTHSRIFDTAWADGMDASFLIPLGSELAKTTMKLVRIIGHTAFSYIANSVINDGSKQQDIIRALESDGINLRNIGPYDMLRVIDASLGLTCSASLTYDSNSNIITMESHGNRRQVMPWALLLANLLRQKDISATALPGISNGKDLVHIKLTKKLTLR